VAGCVPIPAKGATHTPIIDGEAMPPLGRYAIATSIHDARRRDRIDHLSSQYDA
jgi:hypothetical protein